MSEQYPPPPPGGPGQLPVPPKGYVYNKSGQIVKKTHKFRNFVVFPFVGFVALIIVIVAAASGGGETPTASTAGDDAASGKAAVADSKAKPEAKADHKTKPATNNDSEECSGDKRDPCVVKLGQAWAKGKHRLDKGWKVTYVQYVGPQLEGSVTNISDEPGSAFFNVKFLKGSKVVANMQCTTGELEPGQSEDVECFNMTDKDSALRPGTYDIITAETTF